MSAPLVQGQPRVLVSVLNWNQFEMTLECLRSLEQMDYPDFKVVVVDNGSRSFPETELTSAFPSVDVIRSSSNLGYAGGHKLAVDHAFRERFDAIWLLNNDAFVEHDTLSELVSAYLEYGDGIYGSVQLLNDGSGRLAPWTLLNLDRSGHPDFDHIRELSGCSYDDFLQESSTVRPVAKVSGSSMLIPNSVIRAYGFINESFFLYSEEADYCLRLQSLGIPSTLVPTSIIRHNQLSSSRKTPHLSNMLRYYQIRNAHVVARRHRRFRQYLSFLWSDLRMHFHAVMFTIGHDPLGFGRSRAYYQLLGLVDAYLGRMGKRFAPEDFLDGSQSTRVGGKPEEVPAGEFAGDRRR